MGDDHSLDLFEMHSSPAHTNDQASDEPENNYPKLLARCSDFEDIQDIFRIHDDEETDLFSSKNNKDILQVPSEDDVITDFLLSISTSFKEAHTGEESNHSLALEDFEGRDEENTTIISEPFLENYQVEGTENLIKKDGTNRVMIDTTAPFESVKAAVSKFGGILDWKAHKVQSLERRKLVEQELLQARSEIPIYKKQYEKIESTKIHLLKELDSTKRLVEELKLNLEKAQTEEQQAKQDLDLINLRFEELEKGIIENGASVSAKAQLEVARSRYLAAKTELAAVRTEAAELRRDFEALVLERERAVRKAEAAVLEREKSERLAEEMTVEVIDAKEGLEFAHGAHLEAEEGKVGAVLERERESAECEREMREKEEERESLERKVSAKRDKKKKLDTDAALLAELKIELAAYVEIKSEMDRNNDRIKKEIEEIKLEIGKVFLEINGLKTVVASLKSEIERERSEIIAIRSKKEEEKVLEGELGGIRDAIFSLRREKQERGERMAELPIQLQVAGQELDHAKMLAKSALEEWEKQKIETEKMKNDAKIVEIKLIAARKEIEAANASQKLALAAIDALKESENGSERGEGTITLSLEEYYKLGKRAHEAEERAKAMVASVGSKIETAKENESKAIKKLEKVGSEMVAQKEALVVAIRKAENAKEAKLSAEQELRIRRGENERRKSDYVQEGRNPRLSFEDNNISGNFIHVARTVMPNKGYVGNESRENVVAAEDKGAKKKKKFFSRIFMFLARRKAHASKSK